MRIGLFLSRDNGVISHTVDVASLAREFSHLAATRVYDTFFSALSQRDLADTVRRENLTGVVLAGNSPRYYRRVPNGTQILQRIVDQGVNPNHLAFANLKEQIALPHASNPKAATRKAHAAIRAALAKLEVAHVVETVSVAPRRAVLIVGSSEGALLAAQALLAKDYRVTLIEASDALRVSDDVQEAMLPTRSAVESDERAQVLYDTTVRDVAGWCGDYSVTLNTANGARSVQVGGIVLALAGDVELIRGLRPKLQLDVDADGQLAREPGDGILGRTKDLGVWFVPRRAKREPLSEIAARASAVVLSLTTVLDSRELAHPVLVSEIDEKVCGGCGTCVKTCAFSASGIDLKTRLSTLDTRRCKGCGNCVVACPTGARDLISYPEAHAIRTIAIYSESAPEPGAPKVLALLCAGCGYPAADAAGELAAQIEDLKYSPNVLPLSVECGGNVDTQYVLQAFRYGFDGVAVTVCRDGHCHHVVGNTDMDRRLGLFREVLRSRRIDPERLRVIHVSPQEGKLFSEEIQGFCRELAATGRGAAVA